MLWFIKNVFREKKDEIFGWLVVVVWYLTCIWVVWLVCGWFVAALAGLDGLWIVGLVYGWFRVLQLMQYKLHTSIFQNDMKIWRKNCFCPWYLNSYRLLVPGMIFHKMINLTKWSKSEKTGSISKALVMNCCTSKIIR